MNSINSIYTQQQTGQVNRSSSLREAAGSNDLPKLTQDESSLIKEKFTSDKAMTLYSVDGKMNQHQFSRGSNIDTRI
ncbi:MAG: hypothetical protein CL670_08400 [Balneola sp.]|jgi:hypothetical protein|nr:hypothetical protein [Balneola sp.]MBE79158.1 hypothetical protein [Balneola sp.]|tara:strand:- start:500 stop:730 length:231 start_codon:yes stop_codon:yes gene_type:complete